MSQSIFQGFLTKFDNVGGDDPHITLAIKVITETPKMFLNDFSDSLGKENLTSHFNEPTLWDKINFTVRQQFQVKFSDLSFTGDLVGIAAKRKSDNVKEEFEITLTFEKEVDHTLDHVFIVAYLKHKEINKDTDKNELVAYNIEIGK